MSCNFGILDSFFLIGKSKVIFCMQMCLKDASQEFSFLTENEGVPAVGCCSMVWQGLALWCFWTWFQKCVQDDVLMNEVGLFLLLVFSMTERIRRSTLLLAVAFCGHAKPCNLGVF